jgi:hypothetical protein
MPALEAWKDPQHEKYFHHSLELREPLMLDPEATQAILDSYRARTAKKHLYVMLTPEGGLRPEPEVDPGREGWWVDSWPDALRMAAVERLLIYNARSKKCSRPVWSSLTAIADRTLESATFEQIHCIPAGKVMDRWMRGHNSRSNARIFEL